MSEPEGGRGGVHAHPDFGRSVNPISQPEGHILPPPTHIIIPPPPFQIFRPSDTPVRSAGSNSSLPLLANYPQTMATNDDFLSSSFRIFSETDSIILVEIITYFITSTYVYTSIVYKYVHIRCGRVVTDFDWEAKNRFNF